MIINALCGIISAYTQQKCVFVQPTPLPLGTYVHIQTNAHKQIFDSLAHCLLSILPGVYWALISSKATF